VTPDDDGEARIALQVIAYSCGRTEEDDDGPTATTEGDSGSCMVLLGDATLHSCGLLRVLARLLARPTGLEG
jgi:hypothetical protein